MSYKRGLDAIEELAGAMDDTMAALEAVRCASTTGPHEYRDAYMSHLTYGPALAAWLRCAVQDARRDISESYVRLPVGADGKPIRPGETVYGGDGSAWRVECLKYGWGYMYAHPVEVVNGRGDRRDPKPEWLTHECPDSWERLEDDANKTPDRYLRDNCIEPDGSVPNGYLIQRLDLVRRAKALAGVQKAHTCGEEGK